MVFFFFFNHPPSQTVNRKRGKKSRECGSRREKIKLRQKRAEEVGGGRVLVSRWEIWERASADPGSPGVAVGEGRGSSGTPGCIPCKGFIKSESLTKLPSSVCVASQRFSKLFFFLLNSAKIPARLPRQRDAKGLVPARLALVTSREPSAREVM